MATTTSTTTTTTTTSTTIAPTTLPTTDQKKADVTTSPFAEEASSIITTGRVTEKAIATTKALDGNSSTYLVLAIVLSVVVCITIILVICFVTYRRGMRSKQRARAAAQKAFDSKVTPKNPRYKEVDDVEIHRASVIIEPQGVSSSQSKSDVKNRKSAIQLVVENEKPHTGTVDQPNGTTVAEPQYVNLTMAQSTENDDGTRSPYVELTPGKSPPGPLSRDSVQSNEIRSRPTSRMSHPPAAVETFDQSLYENFESNTRYQNVEQSAEETGNAIYQNTTQAEQDNMYEQAFKPGGDHSIYVDMK